MNSTNSDQAGNAASRLQQSRTNTASPQENERVATPIEEEEEENDTSSEAESLATETPSDDSSFRIDETLGFRYAIRRVSRADMLKQIESFIYYYLVLLFLIDKSMINLSLRYIIVVFSSIVPSPFPIYFMLLMVLFANLWTIVSHIVIYFTSAFGGVGILIDFVGLDPPSLPILLLVDVALLFIETLRVFMHSSLHFSKVEQATDFAQLLDSISLDPEANRVEEGEDNREAVAGNLERVLTRYFSSPPLTPTSSTTSLVAGSSPIQREESVESNTESGNRSSSTDSVQLDVLNHHDNLPQAGTHACRNSSDRDDNLVFTVFNISRESAISCVKLNKELVERIQGLHESMEAEQTNTTQIESV